MTLIVELHDDRKEAALKAKAQAQGVSAEEYAAMILDRELEKAPGSAVPSRRHISEVILDIMNDVPREVFEALPKDGAREHDHYLYGSPKQSQ